MTFVGMKLHYKVCKSLNSNQEKCVRNTPLYINREGESNRLINGSLFNFLLVNTVEFFK